MKTNSVGTNPAITAFDVSEVFVGNNEFEDKTITLSSGATLPKGQVLGAITASGKFAKFESGNSNGTELPKAILAQSVTNSNATAAADISNARVCIIGKVDEDELVFSGTDTISTIVTDKGKVKDLLKSEGILSITGDETNNLDNGASFA